MFSYDLFAVLALPLQFAVPPISHVALLVDQVHAGPHRVAPGVPVLLVIVGHDRKCKLRFGRFLFHFFDVELVATFRCVNPDDRQTFFGKTFLPIPVPGIVSYAVNSPKRPDLNRDNLPLEPSERQRFRIDPFTARGKLRRLE